MLRRDAIRLGLTAGQARGRSVAHPFYGVVSTVIDVATVTARCRAYAPLLRSGQCFSHATAALLYGMPLPNHVEMDPRIHLASFAGRERPRARGVVGHELYGEHLGLCSVRGLPVMSPADTWSYLAALLRLEDVVAVGDFLISGARSDDGSRVPLETVGTLSHAICRHVGKRGIRTARLALPLLRTDVDSRPESLTRLLLVSFGLPEPVVNPPVVVDGGRAVLHLDLAWPQWRTVLEYEGDGHRTDVRRFRADIRRRERFEAAGWHVIRVTYDDIFVNQASFIARVRQIVASRMR